MEERPCGSRFINGIAMPRVVAAHLLRLLFLFFFSRAFFSDSDRLASGSAQLESS